MDTVEQVQYLSRVGGFLLYILLNWVVSSRSLTTFVYLLSSRKLDHADPD